MSDYVKRTIMKEEVPSIHVDTPRSVKVYLPPGYNELLSYPVVYCQDGNDFFTMGRIATISNQLILEEGIEPYIVVGVSVDRNKRTSEYSPSGSRNAAYQRFFTEELIPYIEERYPVRRDPGSRILAGDSLGGTVSLHLALEHPDLFPQVLALSGAFFQTTLDPLLNQSSLSWLRIWMVVGLDETAVETSAGTFDFVQWNREAKQILEDKQATLSYREKPGNHVWGLWQKELPDALRYFFPPPRL
ncbi:MULTISPECIES: alpha/beta hydrolase [Brevibacillus]|uniref:alpha/beta hydrolase n=1 Tax=Brevibacillus TaxID=55080 RepID=UPI0002710389|nr:MULTISPECIES: alpha/beta hydrolase-fold protein [Brevibacillus]EJL29717.1 enterochelin esterase-like enzyme [Brevibacillus sp. BC25]PSJ66882.1 esterase family protein [Brevibacillus brevis]RED36022.1 enterochelin esterase-like enzyme [Brevibacillus brevis]TQK75201.1 enterochelin esterase-like enzyme [Brevibacillus sp. AG162]VEF88868.1 Endo-1,4-beta-xylanase Z precursor [Brevibacillus brevis]